MEKSTKTEIQNLRTELNLYKKLVNKIYKDINELSSWKDHGTNSSDDKLSDIKENIDDFRIVITQLKK